MSKTATFFRSTVYAHSFAYGRWWCIMVWYQTLRAVMHWAVLTFDHPWIRWKLFLYSVMIRVIVSIRPIRKQQCLLYNNSIFVNVVAELWFAKSLYNLCFVWLYSVIGWIGSLVVRALDIATQQRSWFRFLAAAVSGNSLRQAAHTHAPLSLSSSLVPAKVVTYKH